MKHTLLSISAFLLAVGFSVAQTCTPDNQFVGSSAGLYPAGPLGPTCELTAPKTIVSLTDTAVPAPIGGGNIQLYITSMRVNNVVGLPTGLQFSTDVMASADANGPWGYWNNSGSVPNQTAALGCGFVYGTSGDWDAAIGGGPNNDGEYPIVFYVDALVSNTNPSNWEGLLGTPVWVSDIPQSYGGGDFVIYDTLVVASDYANISTTITGDSNVEPGTQYTYSVPQDPNVTYNWTVTNGTIQSGQGTNSVDVVWTGSGNVQVDLTDGGCQGVDDMDVTAIATGLDEVSGINASVYPNPSNGVFNLRLENSETLTVRIMDVSGKTLRTHQLSGSTLYSIDMQTAPIGVYILELESTEGKTFKRLVKN